MRQGIQMTNRVQNLRHFVGSLLRFKNQFCYFDFLKNGDNREFPLGRLRYFRDNVWSLAFFTYCDETYQPCVFLNGELEGTL